jgi:hypothetical protein
MRPIAPIQPRTSPLNSSAFEFTASPSIAARQTIALRTSAREATRSADGGIDAGPSSSGIVLTMGFLAEIAAVSLPDRIE